MWKIEALEETRPDYENALKQLRNVVLQLQRDPAIKVSRRIGPLSIFIDDLHLSSNLTRFLSIPQPPAPPNSRARARSFTQ